MIVFLKYIILTFGFIGALNALYGNIAAGITAAGAFIAFAIIESQDVRTVNNESDK